MNSIKKLNRQTFDKQLSSVFKEQFTPLIIVIFRAD